MDEDRKYDSVRDDTHRRGLCLPECSSGAWLRLNVSRWRLNHNMVQFIVGGQSLRPYSNHFRPGRSHLEGHGRDLLKKVFPYDITGNYTKQQELKIFNSSAEVPLYFLI